MKIGELASACGVNIQTVRYYERRGLLADPRAGVGGYREYAETDAERLRFVKEAQALGFTLKEVEELLALRAGRGSARDALARARVKLADVRRKIAALQTLERSLQRMIAGCPGAGPASECPIISQFERSAGAGPNRSGAHGRRTRRRKT